MLCARGLAGSLRARFAQPGLQGARGFASLPRPSYVSYAQRAAAPQRGLAFKPRETRKVKVDVKEAEAPAKEWWQKEQPTSQAALQQQQQVYYDEQRARTPAGSEGSQYESMTSGVQAHMQKVYATLCAGIGVAAGASMVMMATGLASLIPPIVPGLLALAPMMYLVSYTNKFSHSAEFRTGLFVAFTALSGMAIAPLLKMFLMVNPTAIPLALFATAGLFGVMTLLAMVAPKGAMLKWGVPLGGGLIMLLVLSVAGMFVPVTSPWAPLLHNVMLYGGLALFTLYIAYDTQTMVADYEAGDDDHLRHAINLFINFQAIFTRLLVLIGMRGSD
ncbi:inhibitor of apoptosis-promoting Bax1-domain-containing protein [Pavlovales sp. CCMP2436]|nr:inhibitor of apoptosis-promoting Bax1-domain-containing protein [Pavlovales sp. CCMP2436]|mmetsp:Transcript_22991/g.58392  ORF Transcript_22991/g.58392 Transcript_22991/m.58392 type:complete len:332 (+) Transcript_22991:28-1023(+)